MHIIQIKQVCPISPVIIDREVVVLVPWQRELEGLRYHLLRKYYYRQQKMIGKELLLQGAPEFVDAVTKRKTPRQAAKATIRNTVKKQFGSGRRRRRVGQRRRRSRNPVRRISNYSISKRKKLQRSRDQFFSKVKK